MTVESQTSKTVYIADGTATEYTVPFYFFNKEIAVYADNILLSEGTDYTVQGSGEASSGEIIFTDAPKINTVITIVRDVELKQLVKFMEGENFPATDYEKSLDKIIMSLQQLRDKVAECISLPKGSDISGEDAVELLDLVRKNEENIRSLPEVLAEINAMGEEINAKFDDYYDKSEVDSIIRGIAIRRYNNVSMNIESIVSDETYEDYPYRADIPLGGAATSYIPAVMFDAEDALSGNYAPVSKTYNGGVSVYMKSVPSSNVMIPSIILF